jgi:hypothetical protein
VWEVAVEYDEDRELTRYVWDYHGRLMTEFELKIGRAIFGRGKAAIETNPKTAEALARKWGGVGDPEIDAALAGGIEAYRRGVRERVIAEHGADVDVNRCPRCAGVARTPWAKQCFWCGFDWHE